MNQSPPKRNTMTKAERRARAEQTTATAAALIAKTQQARNEKTARLRALRLGQGDRPNQ